MLEGVCNTPSMTLEKAKELVNYYDRCRRVVDSPDIEWHIKYDFIFDINCPKVPFGFCPYGDRDEVVNSFMLNFEQEIGNYRGLIAALED